MDSEQFIIYDTTVVTGLEKLAQKEIEEKIPDCRKINRTSGHVFLETTTRFDQISKLCSVDNIYVIIYENSIDLKNNDLKKLEDLFSSLIDKCDWKTGIDLWREAVKFEKSTVESILDSCPDSAKPSFRVSCNRSGEHKFTSQEASCLFGGLINDRFGWKVSLKKFDMEVLLIIKNDSLRISLCLTNESLHKRYIVSYGLTTLRGTIAFNLLQIADIQPGDIICDPLCGTGVIPVECSIHWADSFVIAADNYNVAIEKTNANLEANKLSRTDLICWDTTKLPLKNNSVDVFVTDLPFGKRMGSKRNNKLLYPLFVTEMLRCCRIGTGRIVLLTQDKTTANQTIYSPLVKNHCRFDKAFYVNMGGLDSSIYLLKRNDKQFCK